MHWKGHHLYKYSFCSLQFLSSLFLSYFLFSLPSHSWYTCLNNSLTFSEWKWQFQLSLVMGKADWRTKWEASHNMELMKWWVNSDSEEKEERLLMLRSVSLTKVHKQHTFILSFQLLSLCVCDMFNVQLFPTSNGWVKINGTRMTPSFDP